MTSACLPLNNRGFLAPRFRHGVSDSALRLDSRFRELVQAWGQTVSVGEPYRRNLGALADLFVSASNVDWDGYGGAPVQPILYLEAQRFLGALPTSLPAPELSVDPDGEITFEWYVSPQRVFSISLGVGGRLSYAGIFGPSTSYGTEYFVDELPRPLLEGIRRLYA